MSNARTIEQLRALSKPELMLAVESHGPDELLAQKVICELQFKGEWINSAEEAEEVRNQMQEASYA